MAAEPAVLEASSRRDPDGACVPRAFAATARLSTADLLAAPLRWPRPSTLDKPLSLPSGKTADAAESLELRTVGDLLEHLPRARRDARTVATLQVGETATVVVEVRSITKRPVRRRGMRPLVQAPLPHAPGPMRATVFNQPWLTERYRPGTRLVLHGKYERRNSFRVSNHAPTEEAVAADGEVSHYPATEGLSSTQILALMKRARHAIADVTEPLPGLLREHERLPDRGAALDAIHFAERAETA